MKEGIKDRRDEVQVIYRTGGAGAGGMRTGGMKDKRDEVQDIYRTGGCRAGGIHKNRREKGQEG